MINCRELLYRKFACSRDYDQLSARQGLLKILRHCYDSVPFYKTILQGLGVSSLHQLSMQHFSSMPVLERVDLRDNSSKLISSVANSRRVYWNTSGGSTGEPCRFLQDDSYLKKSRSITLDQKMKWGYKMGDPLLKLWGDEKEIVDTKRSLLASFKKLYKNEYIFNAFRFDSSVKSELLQSINNRERVFVVGYVQALYEFAQFVIREKLVLKSPRCVMVSAGVCYPTTRELLEEVFKCPVVDRYGSREVGNIACQWPGEKRLRVAASCYLEVDVGGEVSKNGTGEIIVTSLINEVMPLIRYRIGDRATLFTDDNDNQYIETIQGRTVDMFRSATGNLVDGEFFTHLLYDLPGIRKFQVVQSKLDLVEFFVQLEDIDQALSEDFIVSAVQRVMGPNCRVLFHYVDSMPFKETSKYRYTISEVS